MDQEIEASKFVQEITDLCPVLDDPVGDHRFLILVGKYGKSLFLIQFPMFEQQVIHLFKIHSKVPVNHPAKPVIGFIRNHSQQTVVLFDGYLKLMFFHRQTQPGIKVP